MSKLNNIHSSYGNSFSFAIANTYSYNVMNASKLPASAMIVSSPIDDSYEDIGSHSVVVTDSYGTPVRLTYDIKEGNGLKFSNDYLSLNIDNKTIVEEERNLKATLSRMIDNSTIQSSNDKIYIEKNYLEKTSSASFGLAKVDGNTLKSDNGEIYVETDALDHATNTLAGIVKPDNKTIVSSNGVLSVVSNELSRGTNISYGIVKADGETIKSDNGTLYVKNESLKKLDNSGLKLIKADDDTLKQSNGVISVNENAIPYASQFTKGKVKIDESQFYVDSNGTLHPKSIGENIIVYDYDEALSLLEERTARLEETINAGLSPIQPEIYSLSCNETTTTALEKPEFLEEPIEMPVQHVYVSLNVITNCDFNISVRYDENEPPIVELKDINYNDEIKKVGVEAIDAVWPSTQMTEKNIILLFDAKNFYSSSAGKSKTTKITIFVKSVDDITAQKEIVYSIIRYNSNFNHNEIETDDVTEYVETSANYSIVNENSHWRIEGPDADYTEHSLDDIVRRKDIYNITTNSQVLIFHGEYIDNNTKVIKSFEQKINVDLLNSSFSVGEDDAKSVKYSKYLIRYVTEDDTDLFYNLKYESKSQNNTFVSPSSLTLYSMHTGEINLYQYIKDDDMPPYKKNYITYDNENNTYNWDPAYAQHIIPCDHANNPIANTLISGDTYTASNLVLKATGEETAKVYLTGNSSSFKVYLKPYKEANSDELEEISACLSISYKNVVPTVTIKSFNAAYIYDEDLSVRANVLYSYTLDGETNYVDLNNINTDVVLPLSFKIEDEEITFNAEEGNDNIFHLTASYNNYNGNSTLTYSFEYVSSDELIPSTVTCTGHVNITVKSNPLLIDNGPLAISNSNGSISITNMENYSEANIRGMNNSITASYIPTHLIVSYSLMQNIVAPKLSNDNNKFLIKSTANQVSYSLYDISGNINNISTDILSENSTYLSQDINNYLVTVHAVNNSSASEVVSYYFGPAIESPVVSEYVKYFYDGDIHSYMKVENVSPYRLDHIGGTYFAPNKNYYFIDASVITSRLTYNLINKINTDISVNTKGEIVEFVSASNSILAENDIDFSWKMPINGRYIVDDKYDITYLPYCYVFRCSNNNEVDCLYGDDYFSWDAQTQTMYLDGIESNSVICMKSTSHDGMIIGKEHYYAVPAALSDAQTTVNDITDVINCAEFAALYMIMHDGCYSIDPISSIPGFSSNYSFSSALHLINSITLQVSNSKLIIRLINGTFECDSESQYNSFVSALGSIDTIQCLITVYPNGGNRKTTILKTIPSLNVFKNLFGMTKLNGFTVPYLDSEVFNDILTPYDFTFEISNTKITSQSNCIFAFKFHGLELYSHTLSSNQIITDPNDDICQIFRRADLGINIEFSYKNGTCAYSQINTVVKIGNEYQNKLREICGLSSLLNHKKFILNGNSNFELNSGSSSITSYDIFLSNDSNSTYWKLCDYEHKKFELCYINGNPAKYDIEESNYIINSYSIGTQQ